METSKAEGLERAVTTLNDLIALARESDLGELAEFLAMAKLQAQLDLNGITDYEFNELCLTLEGKRHKSTTRTRSGQARNRRDADMQVMKRGWQCRDGVALRGGRDRAKR